MHHRKRGHDNGIVVLYINGICSCFCEYSTSTSTGTSHTYSTCSGVMNRYRTEYGRRFVFASLLASLLQTYRKYLERWQNNRIIFWDSLAVYMYEWVYTGTFCIVDNLRWWWWMLLVLVLYSYKYCTGRYLLYPYVLSTTGVPYSTSKAPCKRL